MHLVLLAHHVERTKPGTIIPDYEAALKLAGVDLQQVELCPFVENGLSSVYHALAARLRKNGRILPGLLEHVGAKLKVDAYESIGLVTWSAPYALAEDLLGIPVDRDALSYWVALDSGYSTPTAGVVDWARLARDNRKLYEAYYTDVATSGYLNSKEFLDEVQRQAGAPSGFFSIGHLAHNETAYRAKLAGLTGAARSAAASRFWEQEHIGALHVGPSALAEAFKVLDLAIDVDSIAPPPRSAIPPPPPKTPPRVLPTADRLTLRRGMHDNDEVKKLQAQLNQLGSSLHVDGDFGSLTEKAVIAFQLAHHVGADGVVEKSTRAALARSLADLDARSTPTEPPVDDRPTDIDVPPSSPTPLRLRCLARVIAELGVHETPGPATTPRVQEYLDGCVRADHLLKLHGDEPAWCCAFQGWAEHVEALPGDVVAPWRAAVSEAWADAVLAKRARPKEWIPRPGDLAVFGRVVDAALQDPRVGGAGHLARVEIIPNPTTGLFKIVGGNQGGAAQFGGAVTRETRWIQARELVGWIEVG